MPKNQDESSQDLHADQAVLSAGPSVRGAGAALVLVHGRGGSAESMLALYEELAAPRFAVLAPQAAGHSWYPHSFLAPLTANEPWLGSALRRLEGVVQDLLQQGVASERIVVLGFSQGACLTVEFAAQHPRRYGGIIGLTGGLIGPPGAPRNYSGSLGGTAVFLGSGDPDPHVPFERVQETRRILEQMGAVVELRRYPGMPHSINEDELQAVRTVLSRVSSATSREGG